MNEKHQKKESQSNRNDENAHEFCHVVLIVSSDFSATDIKDLGFGPF